jgi:hypothetical protein
MWNTTEKICIIAHEIGLMEAEDGNEALVSMEYEEMAKFAQDIIDNHNGEKEYFDKYVKQRIEEWVKEHPVESDVVQIADNRFKGSGTIHHIIS